LVTKTGPVGVVSFSVTMTVACSLAAVDSDVTSTVVDDVSAAVSLAGSWVEEVVAAVEDVLVEVVSGSACVVEVVEMGSASLVVVD
jgi:hypothetical protein